MESATLQTLTDHLGRTFSCSASPTRIVSLIPSITELLFDLNVEVVGRTRFCKYPTEKLQETKIIGGTKDIEIQEIIQLKPDLVIANKEENDKDQILALAEEIPVFVTNIETKDDALDTILELGIILNRKELSETMVSKIVTSFKALSTAEIQPKRTIYLIWRQPFMTINKHTFIHSMLDMAGFINVFSDNAKTYPAISEKDIESSNAEIVLLSSEPYHFQPKHFSEIKKLLPKSNIKIIDSEMITWYGSRMLQSASYLQSLQTDLLK